MLVGGFIPSVFQLLCSVDFAPQPALVCSSSTTSGCLATSFLSSLKVVSLHLIGSLTWGTSNLRSAQIYFVLRVSAALVLPRSKLDVLSSQGAA